MTMDDTNELAAAVERLEQALARRAGFGVGTATAVTTLDDGVACSTVDGPWRIESDLSDRMGGTGTAPSPSALVRAALGSCMAMSYRLRAARHGVPVTAVRVTVETDSAVAGMLLVDSPEPAGFRAVRFHVDIDSPAPVADVRRVLDEGDALSPVLDVVARGHAVTRTVTISPSRTEIG